MTYLVLYRGCLDDLPVRVFEAKKDAKRFAKELTDHYAPLAEGVRDTYLTFDHHHESVKNVLDIFGLDMGTYVGVSILSLKGGVPYSINHYEAAT